MHLAKYAINQEGAESLKTLGKNILTTCNEIMSSCDSLQKFVFGMEDDLGIYGAEILTLIQQNKNSLLSNKATIEEVARRISAQGDDILELIGFENAGGTGTREDSPDYKKIQDKKNACKAFLVNNGYAEKVDFGGLDAKTAEDIALAIAETQEMFPDLDLKFVGSLQARNNAAKESLIEMYMSAYKKHYPDASEAELLPVVQQQVSEDLKDLEPSDKTIAQSLFVGDSSDYLSFFITRFNGITINESYGSDYDYFKSVRQSNVDSGWKPQNCNTPKATVDHELGHQIAALTDAHNDQSIQEYYLWFMSLNSQQQSQVLSGYAAKDIHEFIAESWSEYRNNPDCRECAKLVSERLLDLYNSRPKKKVKVLRY